MVWELVIEFEAVDNLLELLKLGFYIIRGNLNVFDEIFVIFILRKCNFEEVFLKVRMDTFLF